MGSDQCKLVLVLVLRWVVVDEPYVTPCQRHRGEDQGLLKQRAAVYKAARQRNPERWSGKTRNWNPVKEVWLNPPKENQAEKGQALKAA